MELVGCWSFLHECGMELECTDLHFSIILLFASLVGNTFACWFYIPFVSFCRHLGSRVLVLIMISFLSYSQNPLNKYFRRSKLLWPCCCRIIIFAIHRYIAKTMNLEKNKTTNNLRWREQYVLTVTVLYTTSFSPMYSSSIWTLIVTFFPVVNVSSTKDLVLDICTMLLLILPCCAIYSIY